MTNLKTLLIAAVTVAATASTASAYNSLPFGENFKSTDTLALDFVRSEGAGTIAIYDFRTGVRGELLGAEDVRAGLNTNVKIQLGIGGNNDILAVLTVAGEEVLIKDYDVLK